MKQNLQRTSEWIELFLNYAVVFGIEIALNALIGERVPVRVWLAAALYPVSFYLFRACRYEGDAGDDKRERVTLIIKTWQKERQVKEKKRRTCPCKCLRN